MIKISVGAAAADEEDVWGRKIMGKFGGRAGREGAGCVALFYWSP